MSKNVKMYKEEVEKLQAEVEDLTTVKLLRAENEQLRAELASLAGNRDGLEHDWNERGKRIEELQVGNTLLARAYNSAMAKLGDALVVIHEIHEGLGSDSTRGMLQEIEQALKGEGEEG